MRAAIVVILLLYWTPAVQPNAEKDPHHHQTVHEIGQIKDRLKALRDLIDGINEDSCQSGSIRTILCDFNDKISNTIQCMTADDEKHRTKTSTVDFARKFYSNPGLKFFFGADVELSTDKVQKNNFQHLVKSDNLISPLQVMSNTFACASKLQSVY